MQTMTIRRFEPGRRLVGLCVLIVTVLLSGHPALGLDLSAWVPGLRAAPFLAEQVEYESNIFQTPTRAEDDIIFRTSPGIVLEYGKGANMVSVGYRAEILNFLRHADRDALHHLLAAQLWLEFNRLRIQVRDDLVKTTDPQGTELTGRIESTTNVLAPTVEYRFTERFGVGLSGAWTHVDYPTLPELSREEYLLGTSLFWKVLPKTDLQISYSYGRKDFASSASRDVDRHIVLAGLRGEVTAKLASTFRIGYEFRQPRQAGGTAYDGFVMGGDWIYRPADRLTLTLATDRSTVESIFGNQPFYVATTATVLATHRFGAKIAASLRFTAGDNRYPGKETVDGQTKFRRDTLLGWGGGIGYDIRRWLKVGVDFTHVHRDSNFRQFDFQDDKVSGNVTLQF